MNTSYVVRGLKADGTEVFYTGRAGDGFIGSRQQAFEYQTQNSARTRATNLNRMSALHGVWFIVLNTGFYPGRISDSVQSLKSEVA